MISHRGRGVRRENLKFIMMGLNDITSVIIEESVYIHRAQGPGLLESVFKNPCITDLQKGV